MYFGGKPRVMKIGKLLVLVCISATLFVSCKKDGGDDDSDFPYYFTATIDGNSVKYEADDLNSQYQCGISQPEASVGTDYDIYQGTVIEDGMNPYENSIYVHILKYFSAYPSNDQKLAMITTGNYPYGKSEVSTSTVNGATVTYYDNSGKVWNSELGAQSGSTFSITEVTDNPLGTSGKIFSASFSCKLYDGLGGSIQISNAKIRGKAFFP